jgi:hypothetical protein
MSSAWCDDERCILGTNPPSEHPAVVGYMVGEEWILKEIGFRYKHILDAYETYSDHDSDYALDIDTHELDLSLDNLEDLVIPECEDDVVSVASSSDIDTSYDWLFVNNKFMYT